VRDLRADLPDLVSRLSAEPAAPGGRVVLFVGAHAGEGVSSVAASFAMRIAETAGRPPWLIDLDLRHNAMHAAFSSGAFAHISGGLGPAFAAGLKSTPFFLVDPAINGSTLTHRLFTVHRAEALPLMVTRFDTDRLPPQHKLRIRRSPDYWRAVRLVTPWTIIDSPPLQDSAAALAICPHVDAVVMVIRADSTPVKAADSLRRSVELHGGRIAGVVMTGVRPDALRVARRR
jgi:hypothetical protein